MSSDFPLEEIDRDAWLDFFDTAPEGFACPAGLAATRIAGAGLIALPKIPWSEFNRAIGFGLKAGTEADLDRAIAWLDAHAAPSWVMQIPPGGAGPLGNWLAARQLTARGNSCAKLFRDASPLKAATGAFAVETRLIDAASALDFAATAQAGFGMPPETTPWLAALAGRPHWRVYAAYAVDKPIAAAAMFVGGRHAWLGIDTTLAGHRGRGAQSALIARRVQDGLELGLHGFVAETAPPIGARENFISFRNFERCGFALAYLRGNYGKG